MIVRPRSASSEANRLSFLLGAKRTLSSLPGFSLPFGSINDDKLYGSKDLILGTNFWGQTDPTPWFAGCHGHQPGLFDVA